MQQMSEVERVYNYYWWLYSVGEEATVPLLQGVEFKDRKQRMKFQQKEVVPKNDGRGANYLDWPAAVYPLACCTLERKLRFRSRDSTRPIPYSTLPI